MASPTIVDLANWNPPQRITRAGRGRNIVEKLSPLPSRKVVDLDGNVIRQAASNGIANRSPTDPYGQQTHAEKLSGNPRNRKGTPGGILPYSKCPQGIGPARYFLDEWDLGGRVPCETAHNGKPISNDDPCACIVELITLRQKRAAEINAANEARINKLAMLQEQTAQANLDASTQMAAAAQALAAAARANSRGKKDDEK